MGNMSLLQDTLPGTSPAVRELRSAIEIAAKTTLPVLILGESGSGKEVVAHLVHQLSDRANKPFVIFNAGITTSELAAPELLGISGGYFTGITRDRKGILEAANGGTLLFGEISHAPPELQAILISVLDSNEYRRVGDNKPRHIDIRVIATVVGDLDDLVDTGRFRIDLLQRLSGVKIVVPSLRKRRSDIPLLAQQMVSEIAVHQGRPIQLAPDAVSALQDYQYSGNFRELRLILERAAQVATGPVLHVADLRLEPGRFSKRPQSRANLNSLRKNLEVLQKELETIRARSIPAQPIWQGRSFATEHNYCFVLMPFRDSRDLQPVYRDHVKPVIERAGFRCERADDIYGISGVMQSVWEGINRASLIIADLTERNANVFYELGIAHTLGKPVIMLTQDIDFVPFDLRHLRCIIYSYTPPGAAQLESALERTLRTILSGTDEAGKSTMYKWTHNTVGRADG